MAFPEPDTHSPTIARRLAMQYNKLRQSHSVSVFEGDRRDRGPILEQREHQIKQNFEENQCSVEKSEK